MDRCWLYWSINRNQRLVTTFFIVSAVNFIDFITVKNQHNHTPKMRWKLSFVWRICVVGSWLLTANCGSYHMFLFAFPFTFDAYFNFIGLLAWTVSNARKLNQLKQFCITKLPQNKYKQVSITEGGKRKWTKATAIYFFAFNIMVYLYCFLF